MKQIVHFVEKDHSLSDAFRPYLQRLGIQSWTSVTIDQFFESFDEQLPACLVVCTDHVSLSGMEIMRRLIELRVFAPVVLVAPAADVRDAVQAIQAGVFDFLVKPVDPVAAAETVSCALRSDASRLRSEKGHRSILERFETLSPREKEVLALIDAGKPNKVVAIELKISEKTAETHRARIMAKLKADNIQALIHMVNMIRSTPSPVGRWCSLPCMCTRRPVAGR